MIAAAVIALAVTNCMAAQRNASDGKRVHRSGESQIYFEKTSSHDSTPIRYVARSRAYDLYISRGEADVVLHGGLEQPSEEARGKTIVVHAYASVLRMRFVNSDPPTSVEPFARKRGANLFDAVAYRGIYPGTDVILRAGRSRLNFQLNLSPGADARNIVLELAGATGIQLDAHGNAVVQAGRETIVLRRPTVRIALAAEQTAPGAYVIESGTRLRLLVNGTVLAPGGAITD